RQAAPRGVPRRLPARRPAHQVLRVQARRRPGPHRGARRRHAARPRSAVSGTDFDTWSREVAGRVETALSEFLPSSQVAPARLHDAMRYSTLGGGKRVRSMLVFAAGELARAPVRRLAVAASAVEMIHAYSLIQDDLPCRDDE